MRDYLREQRNDDIATAIAIGLVVAAVVAVWVLLS